MVPKLEADWFETPLGQHVLYREQRYFDHAVSDVFGFNAVQVGLPQIDFLRNSRIPLRVTCAIEHTAGVRADPMFLPFESQSLDLLLLPHVLEFSAHPHQVLREAERVLRPEGRLVMTGFNPRSLWGLARTLLGGERGYPWNGSFLNISRVKDWMVLLGLEVAAGSMCCYRPPINRENWLRRLRFMEPAGDRWWAMGGGVYFLQAVKRVHGMNVILPQWKKPVTQRLLSPAAKVIHLKQVRVRRER
ncbi:MAG: class I SAM-dependent methyltransferase [Sulfuriferula multivorans]|uniref:Class I SAM-dependent methyltransferase n=1 Tax=Sulfuriferula multivorans TaxID=1559896 RepID=A0A7C9TD31_9PROT|nr:class I SAM-dependent methyltransferase [Sulfuriferula multivorans]